MKSANENKDLKQELNQEIEQKEDTIKKQKGNLNLSMKGLISFLEGILDQFNTK